MSRDPENKSKAENGLPIDGNDEAGSLQNQSFDDLEQEEDLPAEEKLEDEEEEFSLDILSQAYAKVLKGTAEFAEAPQWETTEALAAKSPAAPAKTSSPPSTATFPSDHLAQQDVKDNAGCPITPESIVEAIVFVGAAAGTTLTIKKIASLLRDVSPKEIKGIVKKLNERYEREQAVYRIHLSEGSLYLELDESMHRFQNVFLRKNKGVKLNASTIEVLAIVAYNQPVSREQIESIRKKPSGAYLNQLLRRELIAEILPEKKSGGKKFVTTEKFLAFFHLAELGDLPQSHEVSDLEDLIN
jgi:segregation and condensation protein B